MIFIVKFVASASSSPAPAASAKWIRRFVIPRQKKGCGAPNGYAERAAKSRFNRLR